MAAQFQGLAARVLARPSHDELAGAPLCDVAARTALQLEADRAQLFEVGIKPLVELICSQPALIPTKVLCEKSRDDRGMVGPQQPQRCIVVE